MTDTKEDKTNDICERLAEELEPLPENKAIISADWFLILAWVW
jgi:hypothetical protein